MTVHNKHDPQLYPLPHGSSCEQKIYMYTVYVPYTVHYLAQRDSVSALCFCIGAKKQRILRIFRFS
jgi:hypothetical protein